MWDPNPVCAGVFLHFSVDHTLCGTLIGVTSVWFFCSSTNLGVLCPLPVYWETVNQQDKNKITIIVKAHMSSLWLLRLLVAKLFQYYIFIVVEG